MGNSFIQINIAGDFYASKDAIAKVKRQGYDIVYNDLINKLKQCDLSLVNLESPIIEELHPIRKTGPNLGASSEVIRIIKYGGFNVACLANNHILDHGRHGIETTIKLCQLNDVRYLGAGLDIEEARRILYEQIKGRKIAIMNITENEFSIAGSQQPGACPLDLIDNVKSIKKAKSEADYLLLIYHGGLEHYHLPTKNMVKTLRFFIDCGVDAIICHHSHYPTGYELYNNKPIFYGIGNFFFDLPAPTKHWNLGYFVTLQIDIDSLETQYKITPFAQNNSTFGLTEMEGEALEDFVSEYDRLSLIIKDDERLDKSWKEYASKEALGTTASLFPFIPFKRNFLKRKSLPRIVMNKTMGMLNTFRCESLRELYVDGLTEFVKGKEL